MKRFNLINWLIKKYGYFCYLEIGIDNPNNCFNKIKCDIKYSVDPHKGTTKADNEKYHYRCTSDTFFNVISTIKFKGFFDIVFIDGLHESEQVLKDVENSLKHLSKSGTIIIHDCNPYNAEMCTKERHTGKWTGDVWKAFAKLRATRTDLEMYCVDTDFGCGIIRFGKQELYTGKYNTYNDLDKNRNEILKLITVDDFCKHYQGE